MPSFLKRRIARLTSSPTITGDFSPNIGDMASANALRALSSDGKGMKNPTHGSQLTAIPSSLVAIASSPGA